MRKALLIPKLMPIRIQKNDLPLLEWADVAIAVCPDETLHAYALAHHWAVEDWSIKAQV